MEQIKEVVDLIFAKDTKKLEKLYQSKKYNVNDFILHDRSALALAASCNYTNVMECLINQGADINLCNGGDLGYTPIEEAAREGKIDALKLLIKKGAIIDKGNTINTNALIGACIGAQKEALEILLENGANINHKDANGQTALHYLCRYAKQWGSAVITQTVDGVTTELENPRFKQHTAIFNILLKNKADANLVTNYGYTPLHLAAETNTHTFIKPLVKHGADCNVKNSKGFTPLHAASDRGNIESCKELVAAGAEINVEDEDGFSPLLGAVSSKNLELVKFFLKKGATKTAKAKISYGNVAVGDTVVTLAQKLGDKDLLAVLEK